MATRQRKRATPGGSPVATAAQLKGKKLQSSAIQDDPMAALKKRAKAKALPAPAVKAEAETRVKLVRDSFTMPSEDYALIALLKSRAIDFKRPAKKSELLRAGLQVLMQLPDGSLQAALNALRTLPTGRPKKKR